MNTQKATVADWRIYPVSAVPVALVRHPASLEVTWSDGRISPFHHLWLRDNCPCPVCVFPVTREQMFEIADAPDDLQLLDASIEEAGALQLGWSDGHASLFDPGWLRAHAYDPKSRDERASQRARPHVWRSEMNEQLARFDYKEVMTSDRALADWLRALRDHGLTQIHNAPTAQGSLDGLARRVAFIRESSFGVMFEVKSKVDADSNAYTAFNLPLHTDLPTRELQPGVQFLYCLRNDALGGESRFVDGFAVAEELRRLAPDSFDLLTRTGVEFRNKSARHDYRYKAPIIALSEDGSYREIRIANFLRAPFDVAPEVMPQFYEAYGLFIRLTRAPHLQVTRRLEAGQVWVFDNRRVLHARDAFDPTSGDRHFQGCYLDRDELLSRLYGLERQA
jgi:gamma-butyrobetaine dioxygenase